jgi:hypothetical protein
MRWARLEFVGTFKQSAWKGALSCALIFELFVRKFPRKNWRVCTKARGVQPILWLGV